MAIVFQAGSELNKALSEAGKSIGGVIQDVSKQRREQRHNTMLSESFDNLPQDATAQDYIEAGRKAINAGVPTEKVQAYTKSISDLRKGSAITDKGSIRYDPETGKPYRVQSPVGGTFLDGLDYDGMVTALEDMGLETDDAKKWGRLYENATSGGKTQITKTLLDMIQRGEGSNKTKLYAKHEPAAKGREPVHESGFEFPALSELDPWAGFTQKEIVGKRKQNSTLGDKDNKNTSRFMSTARVKEFALSELEALENRGNLPDKLGIVEVRGDGSLRLPAASHPDAQEYVKVINDFQRQAKDVFGARVTNFELERFMATLPGLLNSKQGRRQIIDYMKRVHKIEKAYHQAREDVLRHYGADVLDPYEVNRMANDIVNQQHGELIDEINKLDNLQNFPEGRDELVNKPEQQENKHPEVGIKKGNLEVIGPKGQIKQMPDSPELREQLKKWEGWNIRE